MKRQFIIKFLMILLLPVFHGCELNDLNEPCQITGKITDLAGKGIPEVTIKCTSKSTEQTVTTSADGTYTLKIPSGGPVSILCTKETFVSMTTAFALLSGEKKVLDLSMKRLSEQAFMNFEDQERFINNRGEAITVNVRTNVSYEFTSNSPWITCTKDKSVLTVVCTENETDQEREAIIVLKGEYNLTDTLKIKQLAGPVLRVVDYIGKNLTNTSDVRPFVTFSSEIYVLAAKSNNLDVLYTLSADRKTVYFDLLKLNVFSQNPLQLTVKGTNSMAEIFNLDLKLSVNNQSILTAGNQIIYFTNDNKYAWILTTSFSTRTFRQFSTFDFKELNQINLPSYGGAFYNPYNNSFYIVSQIPFEDRTINEIKIYDAATAAYKDKFTVDKADMIQELEFSDTGFGIMVIGSGLYYLDSSNNNSWGLFSNSVELYDRYHPDTLIPRQIEMSNNNKTFVLYGQDTSGAYCVYTINAVTKELMLIYRSARFNSVVVSNSGTGALYFSRDYQTITYQDVLTKSTKVYTLPTVGVGNLAILATDNAYPDILTSDMSVISGMDNSIHTIAHQGEYYYLKSSNDGKLVLINANGLAYLLRSEIFTKYINSIQ